MSSENLRNLISTVRELQDLGELVSGRNVFNININYYENYHSSNTESNTNNESINQGPLSPISNEGGSSSETAETASLIETESESSSMSVESDINNNQLSDERLYNCPLGHILSRIPRNSTQLNTRCNVCRNIVNNSDFYRCALCNYYSCVNCSRNIPNSTIYNPSNSTYSPYRYTSVPINNTTLSHVDSETNLTGLSNLSSLDNLTNIITNGLTNTLVDHITNQVTSNPESIYLSVSNLVSDDTTNPVPLTDLLSKSTLKLYQLLEDPEQKCHICNENYVNDDICRKLNVCGHYYHSNCIDNWFISNNNCPICNTTI